MLVLTRKKDEQIRIGDDIIITVIRVKGKSVRLGIQAPRTEPVLRGELEFRDPDRAGSEPLPSENGAADSITSPRPAAGFRSQRPLREFFTTSLATK